MNTELKEFIFTINIDGKDEYITYKAYSREQALFLFTQDGFEVSRIIEETSYYIAKG